ncbi:MAG: hypothetical protein RL375_2839 [Pseudomonadota bacterium]|jgi:hypothetical protein
MPGSYSTSADQVMLIFGLDPAISSDEVRALLGSCSGPIARLCQDLEIEVFVAPGDHQDAYALVHLWPDPRVVHRLAHDLNSRHLCARPGLHGRRGTSLQAWVPSMHWC